MDLRERWNRVREILADALEIDPGERRPHVALVCAGDAELEAEIYALLDADEVAGERSASWVDGVERLTTAMTEAGFSIGSSDRGSAVELEGRGPQDAAEPLRVGRYPILEELGRGGTGVVYRAHDPKLDRLVAIKKLSPSRIGGTNLSRVLQEARSLARFNHPNIATIYSLDRTSEGESFLVLELVEGETLASHLRSGPLSLEDIVRIGVQIARALAAAHQRGIVHRDLKPHNVMVDAEGTVKVLDFGLATEVDDTSGASARFGTLGYMSPEQVQGRSVDARTDVYAFGLLLFECVTGARALDSGRIRWDRIVEPLPERIHALLQTCLAYDRNERYRDMAVVLSELEAIDAELRSEASAELGTRGLPRVPRPVSSFVGRRRELEHLRGIVPTTRLLTMIGPGGVGKTRLAIALTEGVEPSFPNGVVWVTLTWLTSGDQFRAALGAAFGMRGNYRPSDVRLADLLRSRHSLLVLDTCEHLTAECNALLSRLLPECPKLSVVATSLGRLDVPGETVYTVPPLGPEDAAALFEQRARESRPGFRVDGSAAEEIDGICRELDGLPLGIELAAARLRAMSLADIRRHLQRASRPVAGRVRETFSWGYELLGLEARRLLSRLSVFAGGWTLESAEEICGDDVLQTEEILELLTALVEKSFVMYELERDGDDEGRYRMLKTIRDFASSQLEAMEDPVPLRRAHFGHFLALAERAAVSLNDPDQKRWLDLLETEHSNLLEASSFAGTGNVDPHLGLRLALALSAFWQHHAHYEIARTALSQALDLAPADEGGCPERAQVRLALGRVSSVQGDPVGAEHHFAQAQTLTEAAGDTITAATVALDLALLRLDAADWDAAVTYLLQAESAFAAVGHEAGIARTHSVRARMAHRRGALEVARNEYEQALALYRQVGDQRATAGQLNGLADIVRQSGDLTRAEAMYGECLRIAREQGLHQGVAATLINLADLAANRSDWEVARKRMEESLSLGRQTGHIRTIASALGTLAFYHVLHSNHDQARSSAAEGLEISREIGNTLLETHLVLTVAMIAEAAGDRKLAARLAAGAETMRHALGAPPDPRTLGGPTGAVWARFESDDEPDRFENESENSSDGEFGNESDAATEPGADRGPMGDPVASFTQLTEIARAFCSPQTSFDPA